MNPELCRQALAKVLNPNVLVNLVSRRVRQLNAGGGGRNRPLIANAESMGAADIALAEIADGKMGWELPDENVFVAEEKPSRKRKKG